LANKLLYLLIQPGTDNPVIARVELIIIVSNKIIPFCFAQKQFKNRDLGLAKAMFGRTLLTERLTAVYDDESSLSAMGYSALFADLGQYRYKNRE
jgi:hypothetical protein